MLLLVHDLHFGFKSLALRFSSSGTFHLLHLSAPTSKERIPSASEY